jgi:MFS family permease
MWGLAALLYVIGFFQRVAPAVMTRELMTDFSIGAGALGNLSAFYFYSYMFMQVPTGILADTWGPRRLLTLGAVVAGLGSMLFGYAPSIFWANMGRLLVGGSVAVAFVGMLQLAANWMAPRQYALATGLGLFSGLMGAVLAGVPLRLLVDAFGWRSAMNVSGVFTLAAGGAIWWVVRDDPREKGYAGRIGSRVSPEPSGAGGVITGILEVFRYHNIRLLVLIPGGLVACVLTFSGLWGVPYLSARYGMSPAAAASITTMLLVAWGVGGPLFGGLSDRIGRRKPLYLAGCGLAAAGWTLVLIYPEMTAATLTAVLTVACLGTGCVVISFAMGKESAPLRLSGTVSGMINMGIMMGPTIMQPVVGWILDRSWDGGMSGGVRIYSPDDYRLGFSLMAAWAALSFVLAFFIRETHCRQTPSV